jgi:hypothetical protein
MGNKQGAIYEPGELSRVRQKLGKIDEAEAKRVAQLLGGEVGTEKTVEPPKKAASQLRRKTVEMGVPGRQRKRGRHLFGLGNDDEEFGSSPFSPKKEVHDPADDPSILLKTSYLERVKMDRYAAQFEYEIKNSMQVLVSVFSLMGEPVDYVNPRFVNRRMNVYYGKIEQLVNSTRGLFPRNNARRSERLKKTSHFVFTVLDTIRYWNIERIGTDLARIQSHPRSVSVSEFADILKSIYKPLFILEKLDLDIHIKGAYKLLYKLLFVENPMEPKEKNQDLIRVALTSFAEIRREVHYGLYPLMMKFISDRWFPYDKIFIHRRRRYLAFIGATEEEQIQPLAFSPEQAESGNLVEAMKDDLRREEEEDAEKALNDEDPTDPKVIARKARESAVEAEQKAVEHSVGALEKLFPKAGWEKLPDFPDLYPYFGSMFGLRNGYELISPADPLQQTAVLMNIIENICVGLRYVSFGVVAGPDGNSIPLNDIIGDMIVNWQRYIDDSYMKEYLPRLSEYCRMLESSADSKNSVFAKRTLNELRWIKRLYFLPYYRFEALGPPPFKNQDATIIYTQVRNFRKNLTMVAAGIEQGNRMGGAAAKAPCNGIDNPWAQYHFEVPNPVSRRLDALLGPGKRTNAVLIFFALSTATILDNLLNSETSWAYENNSIVLFRSLDNEGKVPVFGVGEKVDADQIFRNSLKNKEGKK